VDIKNQIRDCNWVDYIRSRLGAKPSVLKVGSDMQAIYDKWAAWAVAEINDLEQRIQELETELMLAEGGAYEAPAVSYFNDKRRGNFKNEQDPY